MPDYNEIFDNNKKWLENKKKNDSSFFEKLARDQRPDYLYIGCSDSRVTAEDIMGAEPGEVFVHRNIANMVNNSDLNVMAVINYAVRYLGVKHIVVCGHYGCGGVKAAMLPKDMGILNPWLRNIRDVYRLHKSELDGISVEEDRYRRLVELNVREQAFNVIKLASVQQEYAAKKFPVVHGWVFDMATGKLIDLELDFESMLREVQQIYNLLG